MTPSYDIVDQKISQIEAEMRRIGMWQAKPPPAQALVITQAFGGDKLAFEQWLQFVFIPRVRQIITERGQFPAKSQVADQAYREWKMAGSDPRVDRLIELLREFDGMFGNAEA